MKKIVFTTMLAVCGIAAGLLVRALSSTPAREHAAAHTSEQRAAAGLAATGQTDDHRVSPELSALGATMARVHSQSELTGRIADLERRLDDRDRVASGPDELDEEARQRASEQAEQMFQEQFLAHDHAEIDPAWAGPTRQRLTLEMQDLGERLQNQARLEDMDCRAGSCKATVEFPSYAAAMAGYSPYMSHFYEVNCAITAALAPAEDPEAPYQVQFLFHQCS